jgi:hypothetical protein
MALHLALAEQPAALEWPENCRLSLRERARIEAEHLAVAVPQRQQQRDELAELRSANALLQQRVEALEQRDARRERRLRRMAFDIFGGKAEAAAKAGCDVSRARDGIYLGPLLDGLIGMVAEAFKAERKETAKAIEAARMRFLGLFNEGCEYPANSLVRRSGKLWHAQVTTRAVPEKGSTDWMVLCQDGRDGRDASAARRGRGEPPE